MGRSTLSTLRAFVRLSRPHFLIGGALMFGLGAAVAGEVDTYGYVVGQFMVTAAQLTAHYVNEYADVEADRMVSERTWFSGGSGVLVDGSLARDTALQAAVASSSVAIAAATLLSARSPAASLLGLGALSISWLYSMPPVRLLGTGLGEIATSTVVTVFVPLVGSLAQTSKVASGLWWSAVILFPVHLAMMLAFELPDLDNDRAAGKAVLAVRIGESATLIVVATLVAASALFMIAAWVFGGVPATVTAASTVALPGVVVGAFARRTGRNAVMTAAAVGAFAVLGAALTLGWLAT